VTRLISVNRELKMYVVENRRNAALLFREKRWRKLQNLRIKACLVPDSSSLLKLDPFMTAIVAVGPELKKERKEFEPSPVGGASDCSARRFLELFQDR
jgi:hypothetical protein